MAINTPNVVSGYHPTAPTQNVNSDMLKALLQGAQQGSQYATHMAGIERDAALKEALLGKQHQLDLEGEKAREQHVLDLVSAHPNASISAGKESFSYAPKDTTAAQDRKERIGNRVIADITKDYNTAVGKSPSRVQAAQAILQAIKDQDQTSLGRIKANLPMLEGENYKPTDAERELILQTTGEGLGNKLKNFLGMSKPGLSSTQMADIQGYAQRRLADEQGLIDRARNEVMTRHRANARSLSPEDLNTVESSLGMGAGTLIKQLQGTPSAHIPTQKQNIMSGLQSQQSQQAPQPTKIRVRDKASGQTGTLDSGEFDPAKYDRL